MQITCQLCIAFLIARIILYQILYTSKRKKMTYDLKIKPING